MSDGERQLGRVIRLGGAELLQVRDIVDLAGEPRRASLPALEEGSPPPPRLVVTPEPVRPALLLHLHITVPTGGRNSQALLLSMASGRLRIIWRATLLFLENESGFSSTSLALEKGSSGISDIAVTETLLDPSPSRGPSGVRRYRYLGGRYLRIR